MPFARPTLSELAYRTRQDFISLLELAGAVLRRSMVHILSRVVAGSAHMLHGHLDHLSRQLFADTAEAEFLVRLATLRGVDPKPAGFAVASSSVTGTSGATVPEGARLLRSDGAVYLVDADVTLASGTGTLAVTAELAGADYTPDVGAVLTFESPVAGVDATATVTAVTVDGVDAEDTEELRRRLVDKMRSPPHGGAASDYEAWALEVPGVTRAWVYPGEMGTGTVVVRFVRDNDASPIPDVGEVTAVQAYLDTLRPVTAAVTAAAPSAAPLNFSIHVVPDTTAVRAAVTAELADVLQSEASPGATLLLSRIRTAIGSAEGLTDYALTAPSTDVTHTAGQLATLGTITWT